MCKNRTLNTYNFGTTRRGEPDYTTSLQYFGVDLRPYQMTRTDEVRYSDHLGLDGEGNSSHEFAHPIVAQYSKLDIWRDSMSETLTLEYQAACKCRCL